MRRQIIFTEQDVINMLRGEEIEFEDFVYSVENTTTVKQDLESDIRHVTEGLMTIEEFREIHPDFTTYDIAGVEFIRDLEKTIKLQNRVIHLSGKETQELMNGKKTPNQIRAQYGLEPVTDHILVNDKIIVGLLTGGSK